MKNAKISRRSFLLGAGCLSAAGVLAACKGTDAPSGSTASSAAEPPASSAASSAVQQPEPFLTVEEFPPAGRQHRLHPADGADAGRYHRHGLGGSPQQHYGKHHRLRMGELWSVRHHHPDAGGVRSSGLCKRRAAGSQRTAGAEAHRGGRAGVHRQRGQPRAGAYPAAAAGYLCRKDHQLEGWRRQGSEPSLPFSAARTPAARPCSKTAHSGWRADDPAL